MHLEEALHQMRKHQLLEEALHQMRKHQHLEEALHQMRKHQLLIATVVLLKVKLKG
jgi:Mg/Co/Ni transporter MgtE